MHFDGYSSWISICCIFVIDPVQTNYSEKYNGYTLIMPLTDSDEPRPLTLPSSEVQKWCSSIGSTLPRIADESDQTNLVRFINSIVNKYEFPEPENIFVNNIKHTVVGWTSVNHRVKTDVETSSTQTVDGNFFAYIMLTNDSLMNNQGRSLEPRSYICETSNDSRHCEFKLGNRCYWKKDFPLPWYKARKACLNKGGDLASLNFDNSSINGSLKDFRLTENNSYWIGLIKSVWHWNDTGIDTDIKYSNWKLGHPSNYSAQCLCLDKSSNDYEWIECDCEKEYPFICKGSENYTSNSLPIKKRRRWPVIPDFVKLSLGLGSCALILIIIISAGSIFIIRKRKNRLVISTNVATSQTMTTVLTKNEFPIYAGVQKPEGNQTESSWSASNTTYATVEPAASRTIEESQTHNIIYADLDLLPKADRVSVKMPDSQLYFNA